MENEQDKPYGLRTRNRSRSATPQTLAGTNANDNDAATVESHYQLRRRSKERSVTPGVELATKRSTAATDTKSVHTAMESIVERSSENNNLEKSDTVLLPTSAKRNERRSERQKSKKQQQQQQQQLLVSNGADSSAKRAGSQTSKRTMTSDYSSEEGDRDDLLPSSRAGSGFDFYNPKGDYWNKFPKTDYTYSLTSTCRYEVAPGVLAPPNMSRPSLRSTEGSSIYSSHTSTSQSSSKETFNQANNTVDTNKMHHSLSDKVPQLQPHVRGSTNPDQYVYKRTQVSQYTTRHESIHDSIDENLINERIQYNSWASPLLNNKRSAGYVDSDVEFDDELSMSNHNHNHRVKNIQSVNTFTRVVSTCFFTILHLLTFYQFKQRDSYSSHYYRESKSSKFRQWIDAAMQHMYLLLVKVLLLDSWLLSRASNIRELVQGRRTKILWLILLPVILTIGWWFLPYIASSIPYYFNFTFESKRQTLTMANAPNENFIKNQELENTVELLVSRVRHLELSKSQQSEELNSVSKNLEELKYHSAGEWDSYNKKIVGLEQRLEYQSNDIKTCKSEEFSFIKDEFEKLKKMYAELKTCCETTSHTVNNEEFKKQAEQVVAGYFPVNFSKQDIVKLFQIINSKIQQDDFRKTNEEKPIDTAADVGSNLGVDEVRRIVLGVLKIYDADKTGKVDYALESAGGQIISTRCTQRYNIHTRAFKILGLTLYYESNNPRTVIQGNNLQPGMCWAFQDFPGYLLVKLRSPIYITGFSVEHAPRSNLPNGEMKSAPKKFEVLGLKEENDLEPVTFGVYEFLDSDESLQYFPIQNSSITSPYEYVEMRIHSNHGQLEYTCLYRFRVHGNLV